VSDILIYCRVGFEADAAAELLKQNIAVHSKGPGFVIATSPAQRMRWRDLIFARQLMTHAQEQSVSLTEEGAFDANPLLETVKETLAAVNCNAFSALLCELEDESKEQNELSGFVRYAERQLTSLFNKSRLLPKGPGAAKLPRLHVFFKDKQTMILALSWPSDSPWPTGTPKLRLPPEAPSRSTLKLEEAFTVLLSAEEQRLHLKAGMRVVDLGSSPGGWTYQFVQRDMHVTAIDNGPMDAKLMSSGMVDHKQVDAFKFQPKFKPDWIVCDVVEQPHRIAQLMVTWMCEYGAERAIFNLKLPMKKRFEEVERCLEILSEIQKKRPKVKIRCKQLYHDRKEVTVCII
jgi:23S rRNA (cytidine2498-2'-O)-methyltransferase